MKETQRPKVIRVTLLFIACGLFFGSCFLVLDSLPVLENYWYTHGKRYLAEPPTYYPLPNPIYHFTGCLSLLLAIVSGYLIATRKGWLEVRSNPRRFDFIALAVFGPLAFISALISFEARQSGIPYFPLVPLVLAIGVAILAKATEFQGSCGTLVVMIMGCLVIPFICMVLRGLVGTSFLYLVTITYLSLWFGCWLATTRSELAQPGQTAMPNSELWLLQTFERLEKENYSSP